MLQIIAACPMNAYTFAITFATLWGQFYALFLIKIGCSEGVRF